MLKNHRVLLINSIEEDRAELRSLLESMDLEIVEVSSGVAAVDALLQNPVDLVITAIAIGEFDSWRLARFIRSGVCQEGRTVPIIIVTRAWCERITEITARDFGINHLLSFEERDRLPAAVKACIDSPTKGLGKRNVLVVEDHEDNALLVEKILKPRFAVEIARDGKAGLDAWKAGRHDLVLLDIMLPKMSGGTVLDQILKIDPSQPVVMMTAHGTMDVAKRLMIDGAADFVTKPFRAEELRRICELATRREDYLVSNAQVEERMANVKQLRNLLANIVDSMPSMLIGVDRQGKINLWNYQAEEFFGVKSDQVSGKSLESVWPEFGRNAELQNALHQGTIQNLQKEHYQSGSDSLYFDITIYPLYEEDVVGAVIRVDDVTERALLEERIVQSEKMVSMGQLAAGMAHEINNPLAGVLQNVQVVKQRISGNTKANKQVAADVGLDMNALSHYLAEREIEQRLDAVLDSGKRAAQLIENMLSFSRRDSSTMIPTDLSELIDKSVELAASSYSLQRKFDFRTIEIERDFDASLSLVECNPVQIQQVVFNLLLNGADAMEQKLQKLRANNRASGYRPRFILRTKLLSQTVRVEIEDNGPGLGEEAGKKLFEPFYTTKRIGEGTGLGLSICYFIITETHRGQMNVDSEINAGTRFSFELPQKG